MDNKISFLLNKPLFSGIHPDDLPGMLACLGACRKSFAKNQFVFSAEEQATDIGILLSGSAHIVKEDFWGNRSIIETLEPGDLFAEAFCCAQAERLPVSVLTMTKTEIMLIDYHKIISTCTSSCPFHLQLIKNMVKSIAVKNILLTQKIEHITQRTTREKLLSYFSAQATSQNSREFTIPFNRQELADYLAVDRSAMSNELSKMRRDGLIQFSQNQFTLSDTIRDNP